MSMSHIEDDAMEIDEPATFITPSNSLSKVHLNQAYKKLAKIIGPDDDSAGIEEQLDLVRLIVQDVLSEDTDLSPRVVNKIEFRENLKAKEEKERLIGVLKNSAQTKNWEPILEDDVFFKPNLEIPAQSLPGNSQVSGDAAVSAWGSTFKGGAADALLTIVSNYLKKDRPAYSRHSCIVNSSGTGKSRTVDELATTIITVPMCLREDGSQGFPPADICLRQWLLSIVHPLEKRSVAQKLHGFVYSLLTVLRKHLVKEIDSTSTDNWVDNESLVQCHQKDLASKFRDSMTKGQKFQQSNSFREQFYKEVIQLADNFAKDSQEVHEPGNSPRYKSKSEARGIKEAAEELCRLIDPNSKMGSDPEFRRPLVILAFDESHILTDSPKTGNWTLFSELRRALRGLVDFPIFSLFLSTAGHFRLFTPEIRSDPSSRIVNSELPPLDPITEISYDENAFPALENEVTLDRVVETEWMSHLGRPLFGAYYHALGENENELELFVKQKLLNGQSTLTKGDFAGSLACLSVRFSLEFNTEDTNSRTVACTQVERHMRLVIAASTGFETLVTVAGSEPLVAEAASKLIRESQSDPVVHLARHSDLNCIDRGRRGELVAALIIMQARDMAVSQHNRRLMSVGDFMHALLPDSPFQTLWSSRPTFSRQGEGLLFNEMFENYAMWFNHIIRVEDSAMISMKHLWKFLTRGAMVMCTSNQYGVDIVLPICHRTRNLSRHSVTAILIQVKNSKHFGYDINKTVFDGMDPTRICFFPEGSEKPLIRLVFALASDEPGVRFPTTIDEKPLRHRNNKFTTFDIWCAGLSPKTFKSISDCNLEPYRVLLHRSLSPHDAFEFKENKDTHLNARTKDVRGTRRRKVAPLIMEREDHHSTHVSSA